MGKRDLVAGERGNKKRDREIAEEASPNDDRLSTLVISHF